ncbi:MULTISPECIES: hypothetical protein [unclassified Sphingomonas]|uniref:hypothetical protein n=1 Tax=unclassified Sphingomonas TaxID=196159 RepID=UPI00226AFC35|nr:MULTISPECIES: hypothetical protein [unclassified Sphingomonas]
MRSLLLLVAIVAAGAAASLIVRRFGDGFMAGYGMGVVWMVGAALIINSRSAAA